MNPSVPIEVARQTVVTLLPEILILLAATAIMTAGAFVQWPRRYWAALASGTLGAALIALLAVSGDQGATDIYASVALNDSLAFYARLFLLLTGLLVMALAHDQVDEGRAPEFFGCLLIVHAGSMLVATANELVFLFVSLELVSIPTYLLLYLPRRTMTTQESATKYFFLSIFSSGLLLYGLTFLYGLFGVSNLKALAFLVEFGPIGIQPELSVIAAVFILGGLSFRVAAVPFHFYAPDVYQGSPALIAGLLSWIPKGVGFLAMIRVLTSVLSPAQVENPVVGKVLLLTWIVAAVTMTLGNTLALRQEDLKRLLAYSSIAHAGYLMIGIVAALHNDVPGSQLYLGAEGLLFYLFAYALMTLGVFAVIIALNQGQGRYESVTDLSGLGRSRPLMALAMALCLFSLAGIPPLAGFWGKFQLFAAALSASRDEGSRALQLLVFIGVLNSAAGAYYYLRIVVMMYLRPAPASDSPAVARLAWPTALALTACAGLTVLFGLFPAPISRASRASAEASLQHPQPAPTPIAVTGPNTEMASPSTE